MYAPYAVQCDEFKDVGSFWTIPLHLIYMEGTRDLDKKSPVSDEWNKFPLF